MCRVAAALASGVGLEAAQEDRNDGLDVGVIGEALSTERREKELTAKLGKCHTDEGTRSDARVMRAEAAKFDLMRQIVFDEGKHSRDDASPYQIGNLGTPDHFWREQPHEPQRSGTIRHSEIGAGEQG